MHIFTGIDRHFAEFIQELGGESDQKIWLAAALASQATQQGHVCLDMPSVAGRKLRNEENEDDPEVTCPDLDSWVEPLKRSRMVGLPGQYRPLILDQANRLYLYRYWMYERRVASYLVNRKWLFETIDMNILWNGIHRWFGEAGGINRQQIGALIAVCSSLCLITGGPGTGKTSLVVKILALLLEQVKGKSLRIALAAPTGKAAARLKEAVETAKSKLLGESSTLSALLPQEAFTLHRLLGIREGSSQPRYHEDFPLPFHVVIVDEASMVDLPLMAKLVSALPDKGRLILLGDKDQLASVEPGAIFGDICSALGADLPPDEFWKEEIWKAREPRDEKLKPVVSLTKNYRFDESSSLGRLSFSIKKGDGEKALDILQNGEGQGLSWRYLRNLSDLRESIHRLVQCDFLHYLSATALDEAFLIYVRFRVLCALRVGPYGVIGVNQLIESELASAGKIRPTGHWYHGQPILITQNDYRLKLFNGDVGLIFSQSQSGKEQTGSLRAYFPIEGGSFRDISPSRLPQHETVFAMTVHKSQGSEFDRAVLILPPEPSELLTRELLYTAVTRAKHSLEVWGNQEVFIQSVSRKVERRSGLRDHLMANFPL
jgi:exodeoxyribonuclease V alpha subunit